MQKFCVDCICIRVGQSLKQHHVTLKSVILIISEFQCFQGIYSNCRITVFLQEDCHFKLESRLLPAEVSLSKTLNRY